MKNTIQLYIDDNNEKKGYPITTPDRVIDGTGKSMKEKMKKTVRFDVVGQGVGAPPIDGGVGELVEKVERIESIVDKKINYVTPEMFGAIGDGVADDTEAVLQALQYSEVNVINNYLVTKGTIINKKIHIFGDGKIFIKPKAERIEFLKLVNNSDCIIENITIETERTQTEIPPEDHTRITTLGSNVCGIWLQGTENITIKNVKFFNTEFDIRANLGMNKNITIENCYSRGSSQGIYAAQLKNSIIRNYDIINAVDLGDGDHCIYFKTNNVSNVIIENCTFVASDVNFGNLIRLSNQSGIVDNITVSNCTIKGRWYLNSHSITNRFINCKLEQIYEAEKPLNGASGDFQNCEIKGFSNNSIIMMYNTDDKLIFNNCKMSNIKLQLQNGSLTITNSELTSSIYTSTENVKKIIFMNNNFKANSSGYLIRCGANLKSIVMNNFLDCKYVFTNYLAGNVAINNAYTGEIPSNVNGGQNIKITI